MRVFHQRFVDGGVRKNEYRAYDSVNIKLGGGGRPVLGAFHLARLVGWRLFGRYEIPPRTAHAVAKAANVHDRRPYEYFQNITKCVPTTGDQIVNDSTIPPSNYPR